MATYVFQAQYDPQTKTGSLIQKFKGPVPNGATFEIKAPKDTSIIVMFPPSRDPLMIGSTLVNAGESLVKKVYAPTGTYPLTIYFNAYNAMITKAQSGPEIEVQ